MKRLLGLVAISFVGILLPLSFAFAGYVNGYYRSNGTYVNGYYRTEADGNPYNNYSYPGNYNPNTGSITGGNASTYLDNYYKNSSYSYYSYPTTPTCPSNSYYDYSGDNCKCYSGYGVQGGSCVSLTSICYTQHGYASTYDYLTNSCACSYGYLMDSYGQCTSGTSLCYSQFGYNSSYDSLSKTCQCDAGYTFDSTNTCVRKPVVYTDNASTYYPDNSYGYTNSTRRVSAICKDYSLSYSTSRSGTCSGHSGVLYWMP